jgi:dolichyl-phosphate-mannose-protein mannosyltransferase
MARSPTPQGSLRQRSVPSKQTLSDSTFAPEVELDKLSKAAASSRQNIQRGELEHKLTLALVTVLGFVTRFWGISHPDEVVFDEVHFGKVGVIMIMQHGVV